MGRVDPGEVMLKTVAAVATLVIAASAMTQNDLTISSLTKDETIKAAFNQAVQGHKLPAWVMKGGTCTSARTITLGNETCQVISAYEPCDCGSRHIVVI